MSLFRFTAGRRRALSHATSTSVMSGHWLRALQLRQYEILLDTALLKALLYCAGANQPAVLSLEHHALLSPTVLVDPAGLAEYFKKSSDEEREHAEKLMEQQVLIKSLQYQVS